MIEIQECIDWPEFAFRRRIHCFVLAHIEINVQTVANRASIRMRLFAFAIPVWRIRMTRIVVRKRIIERKHSYDSIWGKNIC